VVQRARVADYLRRRSALMVEASRVNDHSVFQRTTPARQLWSGRCSTRALLGALDRRLSVNNHPKLALGALLFCAISFAGCTEDDGAVSIDAALNPATAEAGAPPREAGASGDAGSDGAAARGPGQTIQPYIKAAGIGVTDLVSSTRFYTEVLGLTLSRQVSTPSADETTLQDVRGNAVVLMKYKTERKTKKNPVKLVFAVKDTVAALKAVNDGGGSTASAPTTFQGTTVALGFDRDEYLVELLQVPSVPSNVLVGMGIGVSDLDSSADYYTRVLGLRFERDIDVPGFMDEKELRSPLMKGPSLVLMHYEDPTKDYKDVAAKLVLGVSDAAAFAAVIAGEDPAKLLVPPAESGDAGAVFGLARDLDGYHIEVVE
jgi:predicted enzyme related to lactoylglutathione lyase